MLVITGILAAGTAVFLLGLPGTTPAPKDISLNVSRTNVSEVMVTYEGGADAGTLTTLVWTIDNDLTTWQEWDNPVPGKNVSLVVRQGQDLMILGKFSDTRYRILYNKDI